MPNPLRVHPVLGKGYGWKPGLPSQKHPMYMARVHAAALPSHVNLRPGMPPVYDQGQLGSCTANAWGAAVEFLFKKQHLPDFTPSRLFIYYNERLIDGDVPDDNGSSLSNGANVVSKEGCPHETLWPYDPSQFADLPPSAVFQDGLNHLAFGVQQVAQDLTSMKACLNSGYPIVIGFSVYESFESNQVAKTGVIPMPGHAEKLLGGHAVLVVGYNDAEARFYCRNSWGPLWGQGGYFTMPYAYLTNPRLANDFWSTNRTE